MDNNTTIENEQPIVQFIQYIWIEKYKCLEDFETNFSNRTTFHFNRNECRIEYSNINPNYIEDFMSDCFSLSCIVGQNGTGKTTLLRFIKETLAKEYDGVSTNCIIITFNGKNYDCWYYLSANNNDIQLLSSNCPFLILHNHEEVVKVETERLNSKLNTKAICYFGIEHSRYIYCSNSLSQAFYRHPMGKDELSPSFLIFSNRDADNGILKDPVNHYFIEQFNLQMNLLTDLGKYMQSFSINYPLYAVCSFIYENKHFEKWVNDYTKHCNKDEKIRQDKAFEKFLKIRTYDRTNAFLDQFSVSLFYSMIYEISHTYNQYDDDEYEILLKHIEECSSDGAYDSMCDFLGDNAFWSNQSHEILFINHKNYYDFLLYFKELTEASSKDEYPSYIPSFDGTVSFIIPIKEEYISQTHFFPRSYMHTDIKSFFTKYRKVASFHSFIHFSWGLSDGEQALLDLFSRLYSLSKFNPQNKHYYLPNIDFEQALEKHAVLLLDEIDVSLHPEWQRKIINALYKFVKKIYTGTNIQIILTTHSPIMLSDIPKQNTVFLTRDSGGHTTSVDSEETFAANIFSLFKNAFFLDESGIGLFAEEKLCDLINKIHSIYSNEKQIDEKKKEVIKLICCIGDPYIRHKFELEFASTVENTEGSMIALDQTINELEKELLRLKKKRKELGE